MRSAEDGVLCKGADLYAHQLLPDGVAAFEDAFEVETDFERGGVGDVVDFDETAGACDALRVGLG